MKPRIDPRAWLCWVAAITVIASVTRNPLYMIVLLLIIAVIEVTCAAGERGIVSFSSARLIAFVVPMAAVLNALMVHAGDTVLVRLPDWLPVAGGDLTAEALAYGATNGLVIAALFTAFSAFNRVVPIHQMVRLAPRSFHEGGVVLSIALTFLPQMVRSVEQIRQAQAIRGCRTRGVRGWLPVFLPLLVTALERGIGLAEAMTARGYGAVDDRAHGLGLRAGLAMGLLALLAGWLLRALTDFSAAGLVLELAGGLVIVGMVWAAGRDVKHTRYRPTRWRAADTLVVTGCAIAMAPLLLHLDWAARSTLNYYPYPTVFLPAFDPIIGIAMLGLLAPCLPRRRTLSLSKGSLPRAFPELAEGEMIDDTG